MALSHSRIHINNVSWTIFEKVSDRDVLTYAVQVMKYTLEHFDQTNIEAYDTYANLLYKVGRKEDAIEWEQKAVAMAPDHKSFQETLEKMKRGEKTWPENEE